MLDLTPQYIHAQGTTVSPLPLLREGYEDRANAFAEPATADCDAAGRGHHVSATTNQISGCSFPVS